MVGMRPGRVRPLAAPGEDCLAPLASVLPGLRSGDLVFRTGRDLMARIVLSRGSDTRFSHVGILLRTPSGLLVVHAVPDEEGHPGGVLVEPLEAFASAETARDLGFYRLEALDEAAASRAALRARDWRGRTFDAAFRYGDDRELYCTELVMKALESELPGLPSRVEPLSVPLVPEPVFPPDHLRRMPGLRSLAP